MPGAITGGGGVVLPDTVGSSQITDGSIATADLADGAVTAAKAPGLTLPRAMMLAGAASVDATQGTTVVGGTPGSLDPTLYALTGKTLVWTLTVTACVVSGQTLTITLRNLSDATTDATITVTETSPTSKTASVTVPASAKLYELRAACSGSTAAHYGLIDSAALRFTWS